MALTRKALSAMGVEADKIEQIIEMHSDTVNALNGEIDKAKQEAEKYKAEADKVPELEKKLQAAEKDVETAKKGGAKYEELKAEFEKYKAEQEAKEANAAKESAFKAWLKDMDVSEKGIAMILKWKGTEGVELDDNGKISNTKDLKKEIKDDWGDYIVAKSEQGAETPTPPASTGGATMTREQIDAIEDTAERQKAMLENKSLYGL